MRNPGTVTTMLRGVYANGAAVDDGLVAEIIAATTRGPTNRDYGCGGHEAFSSILFAPRSPLSFEDMLARLSCPVSLIYGAEDPWISPLFGRKAKRALPPDTPHWEVSPAGHCPHHEAPAAVNGLLAAWIDSHERGAPHEAAAAAERAWGGASGDGRGAAGIANPGGGGGGSGSSESSGEGSESVGDRSRCGGRFAVRVPQPALGVEVEVRLVTDEGPRNWVERIEDWAWRWSSASGAT
ncbi:unnamed protein product [Phaeothamnion confervicola]